jgi:glycosyltransferase involved in cell wall biosynthesis
MQIRKNGVKIAIVGTVGLPAKYGGFETLAENLALYADRWRKSKIDLTVYCSTRAFSIRRKTYNGAQLRYSRLKPNGPQSILYDMLTAIDSAYRGSDSILFLGVSGAAVIPFLRLFTKIRIITNIDGIEWRREKWKGLAQMTLRKLESIAVRYSHIVIADNQAVSDHINTEYKMDCEIIAYGGDHALAHAGKGATPEGLPEAYALALCRVEPENNVHTILEAFSGLETPLVFVGNWSNSAYGREMKARYAAMPNLNLLDPIYDPETLYAVRARALVYVHGHSAGGTNPSLVEMMHFGIPVLAHGCSFNRHSTEEKALYFETSEELTALARALTPTQAACIGYDMREIAQRRYTWDHIGEAYFRLLERA